MFSSGTQIQTDQHRHQLVKCDDDGSVDEVIAFKTHELI